MEQINKKKRKSFSEKQKKEILELYFSSGLNKNKFCQQYNVSKTALYNWLAKYNNLAKKTNFHELKLKKEKIGTQSFPSILEASIFVGEFKISIPEGFNLNYLNSLMQGLKNVTI